MRDYPSCDQSGFTLLEVLVGFAILSLTILTCFTILNDSLLRLSRVEEQLADLAEARRVLALVESGAGQALDSKLQISAEPVANSGPDKVQIIRIRNAGGTVLLETISAAKLDGR
jgi:prepilin-type N-terminal cleavage/methylation domain-containing protein